MSHNEIVSLLNVPENASLGANLSWLKRYLDSIEPTDVLQNLSIHLYQKDDPRQPPLIYNPSGQDPQRQDDCTAYPILYQRQKIGEIYYCGKQQFALLIAQMAKKIALLARRFQANILSSYYLGRELPANGLSEAAFTLDAFIEKAASARCPVVIKGGFGSEKLAVACAIHYNSPNKHRPFVEINCALTTTEAFKLQLSTCFKQAPGGCVYFHGIDELSFSQQSLLIELLAANTLHSEPKHPQINTTDIRLLLSTTQSLSRLVEHNTFSRQLYAELNFLHTTIPPLVQRKEDIDDILVGRIKQHRLFPEQELSTEAKAQFQNYHWPENDLELERTGVRLLAMANNNPIGIDDVKQHASKLTTLSSSEKPVEKSSLDILIENLIPWLMTKNYDELTQLHPGLQKALKYLGDNYCQGITLGELACNAFISPSHLSYLLKFTLKRSFKQILAELRIEKAKQIFASTVNSRITDVSLDVGFGDLSHFEKIFKRYTQMTPRQYKNSHRQQVS